MAEATKKRRWLRRLVVLAVLVAIAGVARDRQFARNERHHGPTS